MTKPAIVVVAYNRPNSLKRILESISQANYNGQNDIPLIISIDKASNEDEVVKVAKDFIWKFGKKTIRTFNERQGLRKHVIQCGDLSIEYGATIILEDDLLVSPNFYNYIVDAIKFYKNSTKIVGYALYSHEWNGYSNKFFQPIADEYDTYLGQFSITWGQCWTKDSWIKFKEWYLKKEDPIQDNPSIPQNINNWSKQSWGKYFVNYIVEKDLYYVIPRISLSTNFSETGQHAKEFNTDHQVRLLSSKNYSYNFAPETKAIKYDIYFENKELSNFLEKTIVNNGVTIDLNGTNRTNNKNRYILSTQQLNYKVIKSYGLLLRPIDMNIINSIEGNEIFLYDTKQIIKNKNRKSIDILRYEIRGIPNKQLLKYVMLIIKKRIRNKWSKNEKHTKK